MKSNIPTPDQVRAALVGLKHAQVQDLALRSGVPFTTLWNIRSGITKNPGIKAVHQFFPLISAVKPKATCLAQ